MSYMDEYRFWLEDDYLMQTPRLSLRRLRATIRKSKTDSIRNLNSVPADSEE